MSVFDQFITIILWLHLPLPLVTDAVKQVILDNTAWAPSQGNLGTDCVINQGTIKFGNIQMIELKDSINLKEIFGGPVGLIKSQRFLKLFKSNVFNVLKYLMSYRH